MVEMVTSSCGAVAALLGRSFAPPRQADLMVVVEPAPLPNGAGYQRLYDQMLEPR